MTNPLFARQAIFNKQLHVEAYELLFRGEPSVNNADFDGDKASSHVLLYAFGERNIEDIIGKKDAFINFMGCDNVHVEGIIIENPSHHTIPSSNNTVHKNIKIIGWSYNQDGIRPSRGGFTDQIFIKSQDDYDYARDPHVVQNSVFWPTHNGACGMIGWNNLGTGYAEYKNMAYINSETKGVKNNSGIIGSQAADGIKLTDNFLEDLVIEDNHAYLVNVIFTKSRTLESGFLNNFTFKNITTEHPFQFSNKQKALQRMTGLQDNWLSGWNFINVIIDGKLLTFENYKDYFNINLQGSNGNNVDNTNFVKNVTFGTEGTLYQINTTVSSGGTMHPSGSNGVITCIGDKDQAITIEPEIGYRVKSITIDGEETYSYGSTTKTSRNQSIRFNKINSNHSIAVTFEQGTDYFDTFLGIDDFIDTNSKINIYPIPAKNEITISNIQEPFSYIIYDLSGKKLRFEKNQNNNTINIEELKSGIYMIEITNSKNHKSASKIIKI